MPSLLLAQPSRFAALSRRTARAVLIALALLLVLAVVGDGEVVPGDGGQGDAALAQALVAALADGRDFYAAVLDLTRGLGPIDPLALPVPALPVIAAHVPGWALVTALALLAVAVLAAWARRLQPLLRPTPYLVAVALLAAGLAAYVEPAFAIAAAPWGGLLLLLALGLWRPGRWIEPAALGLAAALIAPGALLFVAVLAAAALLAGRHAEARWWGGALTLGALAFALHLAAAVRLAPLVAWPAPGLLGPSFALDALAAAGPLLVAPAWLARPLALLALLGWLTPADPRAARVVTLLLAALLALALLAPSGTAGWALLPAPLLLVGLAFVPDALRDLAAAAISRPRITVTRRVS